MRTATDQELALGRMAEGSQVAMSSLSNYAAKCGEKLPHESISKPYPAFPQEMHIGQPPKIVF